MASELVAPSSRSCIGESIPSWPGHAATGQDEICFSRSVQLAKEAVKVAVIWVNWLSEREGGRPVSVGEMADELQVEPLALVSELDRLSGGGFHGGSAHQAAGQAAIHDRGVCLRFN